MHRDILEAPDLAAVRRLAAGRPREHLQAAVEPLAAEVVRLMRVDARRALDVAKRAGVIAAATGDRAAQARARWVRGHALSGVLRPREASECYAEAARAYRDLGETVTAARVSIGLVNTLMYLAEYDEALFVGESAREVLHRDGQRDACARLDMNLGNVLFRLERPAAALRRYDRALRFARRANVRSMIAPVQFNRANALTNLGRHRTAERLYREVGEAARAAGETRTVGFVEYSLGYLDLLRGEYGEAWRAFESARTVFEELGDVHYLVLTLVDLAELFVETNAFRRAKPLARRARATADRHGIRYEAARSALLEAVASLGLGELAQAGTFLEDAAAAFRAEDNRAAGALCAVYLADLRARQGDGAGSRRLLEQAGRTFADERMPLREAAALVRLASVQLEDDRGGGARDTIARARRVLRRTRSPWLRARVDHLAGRLALREGDASGAVRLLRRAVRGVERIRGRIGLDELRVSFGEDKAPIYAELVRALLARGGARSVRDAFEVVERSRSRALVDLLSGRVGLARDRLGRPATALLAKLETLRGEVSWLSGFGARPDGGGEGRRDEVRLSRSSAALREREHQIAELVQRLQGLDAGYGALTCGETSSLADVRRRLPVDSTLVEYYLAGEETWAFVVRRASARVVPLPASRAALVDSMTRLRFQIEKHGYGDEYVRRREAPLGASLDHHLRSLRRDLWDPLEIETERVTIVPHGPLHSLPFAALSRDDGSHLVDTHEILVLPSASAGRYLDRPPRPRERGPRRVLAVGVGDDSIPEVEQEIEGVRRRFRRGRMLRGSRATRERFRREAPGADVIHIATHGAFREDDPHFSSLRFADGWMSLYDLYGMELKADLVCLSACQSGRSWVGGGDELVGLTRGFLHAGAANLLVSLWPVGDDSTARLMDHLYRGLAGGIPVETALRTAMRSLREERPHPYHWAPFFLVGRGGRISDPSPARMGVSRAGGRRP